MPVSVPQRVARPAQARPGKIRPGKIPACALLAALAAGLGGCGGGLGGLGGGSGVMPGSEVGLPPSMRGTVKGASTMSPTVDDDGRPVTGNAGRALTLPKTVRGETRSAEAGARRIDREDLEDAGQGGTRGGNGLRPAMGQNGRVGLGGQF